MKIVIVVGALIALIMGIGVYAWVALLRVLAHEEVASAADDNWWWMIDPFEER